MTPARPIRRLLIANRGEIAIRIARAAREMGIVPLGVYSEADRNALHVRAMDAAVEIGPPEARASYLDVGRIIAAAATLRADAIHPGYGFLSERAAFAQAAHDAGLIFVGPPPSALAAMGSKIEAKQRARDHDVPVVPGYDGVDQTPVRLREEAERIGLPVLIKASAGGGGRGMRVVTGFDAFEDALAAAKREALASFGDDAVLLEKYLVRPRHIEFQILADAFGTTLHLGERECSVQRRHQKLIEEAPSVALDDALRNTMGAAAVAAAESVGYVNAGTVEFMLDADRRFYFLEMNARLQVEHPVTELAHGLDLVHWQLRIASGERLTLAQADVRARGWAIEARLNAEDPATLLPSTGRITTWSIPAVPGLRVDAGVEAGSDVTVYYDSMLAKLIAWGPDRATAIGRLDDALAGALVGGVQTNLPLLLAIERSPAFRAGDTTTRFLEEHVDTAALGAHDVPDAAVLALIAHDLAAGRNWRSAGVGVPIARRIGSRDVRARASLDGSAQRWTIEGDVTASIDVHDTTPAEVITTHGGAGELIYGGRRYLVEDIPAPSAEGTHAHAEVAGTVAAPMPGKVLSIGVREGDRVEARALLLVLEAMKMEHRIEAPAAGTVAEVLVTPGELVSGGAPLVQLRAAD